MVWARASGLPLPLGSTVSRAFKMCIRDSLDRLTVDDAGSAALNGAVLGGLDGACTVDGLAQCL